MMLRVTDVKTKTSLNLTDTETYCLKIILTSVCAKLKLELTPTSIRCGDLLPALWCTEVADDLYNWLDLSRRDTIELGKEDVVALKALVKNLNRILKPAGKANNLLEVTDDDYSLITSYGDYLSDYKDSVELEEVRMNGYSITYVRLRNLVAFLRAASDGVEVSQS